MTPYYSDDSVVLYHGDCRELLPLPVDASITDPPYGTGYYGSDKSIAAAFLASLPRPLALFGWPELLISFCVESGLVPDEWITWWPSNGRVRGMSQRLWRESECIAAFGGQNWKALTQPRTERAAKNRALWNRSRPGSSRLASDPAAPVRRGDVWIDPMPGVGYNGRGPMRRLHPNEKPLAIMARLVAALTDDGMTVLDPFAGSGTTLLAARETGRKAIGIEIDEGYCEVAASRLSAVPGISLSANREES